MSFTKSFSFLLAVAIAFPITELFADDETTGYMEEIIVTAEKREESVMDVPVTMSAFTNKMIQDLGIASEDDLEQLVPGLQFQDNGQMTGQGTTIRGIGTRLAGETHPDLAVATYVNGVYTLGTYGAAPNMFDLERVEVARGPQGTLNGRNSIAGAISYWFKKPTDEWDMLLHTEFTDQFTQRYGIAFGGPITEHVSFRINGSYYGGDGAQENIGFGDDYDEPDQVFFSPQLRFKTDRMDLNLRYAKVEDDGVPRSQVLLTNFDSTTPQFTYAGQTLPNAFHLWDGQPPSVDADCPPITPAWDCGDLENKLFTNRSAEGNRTSESQSVEFSFDISDSLTLRYTYGDNETNSFAQKDSDHTNRVRSADDPTVASDAPARLVDNEFQVLYEYEETSHELQLVSNFDGNFNFIAGLYTYENDTGWFVPSFRHAETYVGTSADDAAIAAGFGGCGDVLPFISLFGIGVTSPEDAIAAGTPGNYWYCPEGSDFSQWLLFGTTASSETEAAFVNMEYQFNDQWLISGGLRYTEDEKTQETNGGFAIFSFLFGVPLGIMFDDSDPNPRSWDATIGHISVEYNHRDDLLLYGRLSTGYRAGSFNPKSDAIPALVDEETLINYEIGMKGMFMDGRLRLTSALFYNDFDDYQITGSIQPQGTTGQSATDGIFSSFSTSPIVEYTANIDDTEIWGAELEFEYYLNDNWRFSGFYAYLDSEIGPHLEVIRGDPDPVTGLWDHIDFSTGQPTTSVYVLPKDMTGNQLPMQPKHKFALQGSYETALSGRIGGTLQIIGMYSWVDDRASDLSNLSVSTLPDYDRFDLRGIWTSPNETLSATLFVDNVFDEIGVIEYLHLSTIAGAPASGTLTRPRTVGLELRWRPQL